MKYFFTMIIFLTTNKSNKKKIKNYQKINYLHNKINQKSKKQKRIKHKKIIILLKMKIKMLCKKKY